MVKRYTTNRPDMSSHPLDDEQLVRILDVSRASPARVLEEAIAREFYAAGFDETRFLVWCRGKGLTDDVITNNIRNRIRDIDHGILDPNKIGLTVMAIERPMRRRKA